METDSSYPHPESSTLADLPSPLADALSGRYRLERELGAGGMATVWLARDLKHQRPVALKLLRPELGAVLGAERFLREIRLTATLQHPHILPLLDSGDAAGHCFYVMPYVEGETLRQRLTREGPLPLEEALRLTREVAEALDYAHGLGIIHRDIKPENLLLSRGHAVVADFGIALAVSEAGGGRLTETGLSLGTPAYMSPEQALAEARLDGRTDQYSLACVLYEMLAGEPPYTGPTAQAVIAKRLSEPVPHLRTLREVPPELDQAIIRALAREPADRFPSTTGFARALEQPAARPRRLSARALGIVTGIGVMGLALAAVLLPSQPAAVTAHRQVTFSGTASQPALSADGRWLAYISGEDLLVQEISASAGLAGAIASARGVSLPRWSPDGSRIFYVAVDSAGPNLYAVPREGGPARRVRSALLYDVSAAANALYVSTYADSVFIVDPTTEAVRGGFSLLPIAQFVYSLAVSPDGRWLAFVGVHASSTFLGVCRTDGSRARRLVVGVPRSGSLGWNASSDAIYYLRDLGNGANVAAGGDIMKVRVDPRTGTSQGQPHIVLGGAWVATFALSSDARHLVYTKEAPRQKIWTMTREGAENQPTIAARELTPGTTIYGTPDISPDGRFVAFARNEGGDGNLYVTPFESYSPRPIATSSADEWSPRWSPDATRIAYAVRDSQAPGILVADVASGRSRRLSGSGLAPLGSIAWTPDGQRLVFPLDLGKHYAVVDVGSGKTDTLAAPDSVEGFHLTVFSPRGDTMVVNVLRRAGQGWHLWRGDTAGSRWTPYRMPSDKWPSPLLWSRDGWIYFLKGEVELWRITAHGDRLERVGALPAQCSRWQTAMSADARRLVCAVSQAERDVWVAENFDPGE